MVRLIGLKNNKMGWECGWYEGKEMNITCLLVGKCKGKRPLGRPRRRWETILIWMLKKEGGRVWIALMCSG
jgi:hypothetical protein